MNTRSVASSSPVDLSLQLILVIAPEWSSASARLLRFERSAPGDPWCFVCQPIAVSLGRSGLAWGRGLYSPECVVGRIKREGDGCTPAGVFGLPAIFGQAELSSELAFSLKLPFLSATSDLKCIDDPESCHYNQLIDAQGVDNQDWSSNEEMLRQDDCYRAGVVIGHNMDCTPGAGSCIFMHVWRADGVSTEGCTAMSYEHMFEICRWLDVGCNPLLVQLPALEYERLREAWSLPHVSDSLLSGR